ncbi:MAG TPA: glycosyltransferase family A protein [Methylomirabilota bacterium]|jgi:glycosyltransferase involved in cell wall biosynthesis
MGALVSVVIATRNRAEQLRRCLGALRRSAPPPGWSVEVVVVDNGSTDATGTVVASECTFGDRLSVRYLLESRQGKAFAVNTGTAAAAGSIVAFLDDDVEAEPAWLGEVVERFQRESALGLLAGRVVGVEGGRRAITRASAEAVLDPDRSLEGLVLGCNLAARREVIAAVRGRDTRLGPGRGLAYEDIDFVYRVLRRGIRGCFSPLPVVVHRLGERNRDVEYLRGRGAYFAKFIARGDRTIAYQALRELNGLWRDYRRGVVRPSGSPSTRAWHLAVGATVMTARMLTPRRG